MAPEETCCRLGQAAEAGSLAIGVVMLKIRSQQDFGAAIVFVALGGFSIFAASNLDFGSSARMGPGYFPTILGVILIGLGIVLAVRSCRLEGPRFERFPLRPLLIVPLGLLSFGVAIERVGLLVTTIMVTLVIALARARFNLVEQTVVGVTLGLLCVGIFIFGLSQPIRAW
jgi:hypothetical protein